LGNIYSIAKLLQKDIVYYFWVRIKPERSLSRKNGGGHPKSREVVGHLFFFPNKIDAVIPSLGCTYKTGAPDQSIAEESLQNDETIRVLCILKALYLLIAKGWALPPHNQRV
jgi:hypothetical protein